MNLFMKSALAFLLVCSFTAPSASAPSDTRGQILENTTQMELSEINRRLARLRNELFRRNMNEHFRNGPISSFYDAAENGDVPAQMNLMFRYATGLSDFKSKDGQFDYDAIDPEKTDYCLMRYWLARAAQTGDVSALAWSAWSYGTGDFAKPNAKLSYFYMSKWGQHHEFDLETIMDAALLLKDEVFDFRWLAEVQSWSPTEMPFPTRASCAGCPTGEADQCLVEQSAD